MQKWLVVILLCVFLSNCSSYEEPGELAIGDLMITVNGQSLAGDNIVIPEDFRGQLTLLLFGYIQDTQFDIDRWLIGLDMTKTKVNVYEVPTIQGMFPRMFSTLIDDGMRSGIPKSLWKGVATIYQDGDEVQTFTGNKQPNNARVVLLDKEGKILYFNDEGFSVDALNELRTML